MKRDWTTILACIGTIVACYSLINGWKTEMTSRMDEMDNRIFWLATGKDLSEVIKEEHLARDAV